MPWTRASVPTGRVHGTRNQSFAKTRANSISMSLPTSVVSAATWPKLVRRSSNAHQRVSGMPSKTTWVGTNVCTSRTGATTAAGGGGAAGGAGPGTSRACPLRSSAAQSRLPREYSGACRTTAVPPSASASPDGADTPKAYSSRDGSHASSPSGCSTSPANQLRSRSSRVCTAPTSPGSRVTPSSTDPPPATCFSRATPSIARSAAQPTCCQPSSWAQTSASAGSPGLGTGTA